MKAFQLPDVERQTIDTLKVLLAGEDVTIGVGVPDDWKPTSKPHVQVVWDGTQRRTQVSGQAVIRVVCRAGSPTEAKRLARLAEGRLCGHVGEPVYRPLIGVLPARDPQTQAEYASFSVGATVRTIPA